ncbi:hypothetical protein D3C75_1262860 [compost metagenome]
MVLDVDADDYHVHIGMLCQILHLIKAVSCLEGFSAFLRTLHIAGPYCRKFKLIQVLNGWHVCASSPSVIN